MLLFKTHKHIYVIIDNCVVAKLLIYCSDTTKSDLNNI